MRLKFAPLILVLCLSVNALAEDFHFESGLRYGSSYASSRTHEFRQAEAFFNWNLPWQWRFAENWSVQPQAALTLGWLQQRHSGGFVGSLGPDFVLRRNNFPITLVAGAAFTALGRTTFEARNFGCPWQFNEHAGLNWELTRRFYIGYRFQHMSNAHLDVQNPGLNIHFLAAGFRF
jgi:hypothetical protein